MVIEPQHRRSQHRDLRDDVFTRVDAIHCAQDWRDRVPAVIRDVWMQMSPGDRLTLVLVAMRADDGF